MMEFRKVCYENTFLDVNAVSMASNECIVINSIYAPHSATRILLSEEYWL
jgi:hypothetical protein